MDKGHQYEHICADILKRRGFTIDEVTQGSHDQGVDVLARKDGVTYAIQCKYSDNSGKKIGNDAVQQVYAGKEYYKYDIAVVMTNRSFSDSAIDLAKSIGVKLWAHSSVPGTSGGLQKTVNKRKTSAKVVPLIVVAAALFVVIIFLIRSPLFLEESVSTEANITVEEVDVTVENEGYILPDSDTRYYSESELSGLTKDELRLARNEIYARHGRKFDSEELQEYFGNQSWYEGTIEPSDFSDSLLNEYEKANLDTIIAVEDTK